MVDGGIIYDHGAFLTFDKHGLYQEIRAVRNWILDNLSEGTIDGLTQGRMKLSAPCLAGVNPFLVNFITRFDLTGPFYSIIKPRFHLPIVIEAAHRAAGRI